MNGLRVLSLAVAGGVVWSTIRVLRRGVLREKYVIVWIAVSVVVLVLAVVPGLLDTVAGWLGIADPPNLLAFLGVTFLLGVTTQLTWEVSRLESNIRDLAEEFALLRHDVEVAAGMDRTGVDDADGAGTARD